MPRHGLTSPVTRHAPFDPSHVGQIAPGSTVARRVMSWYVPSCPGPSFCVLTGVITCSQALNRYTTLTEAGTLVIVRFGRATEDLA